MFCYERNSFSPIFISANDLVAAWEEIRQLDLIQDRGVPASQAPWLLSLVVSPNSIYIPATTPRHLSLRAM
jgi:hypothetical protein